MTSGPRKLYYERLQKTLAENFDKPGCSMQKLMQKITNGVTPSDAEFAACSERLSYMLLLAGIDATVKNDPKRGEQLAQVLRAWGRYQLDGHWVRKPDPVGLSNSFDYEMCLAYDFIAQWMTEEQRQPVRQMIAKMMDGIHIFTWNMPPRWRMWNWAALHVYQGTGSLAIEGEPGFNPSLWNETRMIVKDIGKYNIHPSGALTEDLTYFTLGFEGSGMAMVAMAKRGEQDIWDKSNVSHLKYHLMNQLYPWGGDFQSHADGAGPGFYTSFAIWKYMYPTDPLIDYTWRNRVGEDYSKGWAANDEGIRAWVVPLLGTEHFAQTVNATDLNQPLSYFCPERGYLIARTSWDPTALKLDFEAKQDYPIMGHNHADPNNFNLDALGRMWVTDTGYHDAGGNQHNEVMIGEVPESPWPCPGGRWVDLIDNKDVVIGVSDAKHAYDYHWSATGFSAKNNPPSDKEKWEKETQPEVVKFYEGQEHRTTTGIFDHWTPFLLRSVWNPVERAFRTASLVRGDHPYVLIVDDIQKDENPQVYQWIQQMPDDVEIIKTGGDWVILGAKEMMKDPMDQKSPMVPDNRRLLVRLVDVDSSDHSSGIAIRLESFPSSPGGPYENGNLRKRLTIPARSVNPKYKVLLYPFMDDKDAEMPEVTWNLEHNQATISWKGQQDAYTFARAASGRTVYQLDRNGQTLATLKARPESPRVKSSASVFVDKATVEFDAPDPGQEIHYTLDGSAPSLSSPFYSGPVSVETTATVNAATFAPNWQFGADSTSEPVHVQLTKQAPLPALDKPNVTGGIRATLYEGYWDNLPDFSQEKTIGQMAADNFELPPQTPVKGFGVHFDGLVKVPLTGVYTFAVKADDASKLWIDDKLVVGSDYPHVVQTDKGQIALEAGWHKIAAENCDNALPHGKGKGDGCWAFSVLWAPPFSSGLTEIPNGLLGQEATGALAKTEPVKVETVVGVTEPGLTYQDFNRADAAGTVDFFDTSKLEALNDGWVSSILLPDSSPNMLHCFQALLQVSHEGDYQFRLPSSGLGEISFGDTVVSRVGIDGANVSQPVHLAKGLAKISLKLARLDKPVEWRGPGMEWQPIQSPNWYRLAAPHVVVNGRTSGQSAFEILKTQAVELALPKELAGARILFTVDGSQPTAQSPEYTTPFTVDHTCKVRAGAFQDGIQKGNTVEAAFNLVKEPQQGEIAYWPISKFNGKAIPNQALGGFTGDLNIPSGVNVVDDPERGKVLDLDQSPRINLNKINILNNELTLTYWIKPKAGSDGTLTRYGYAHFGFVVGVGGGSKLSVVGGGNWRAGATPDKVLDDTKWHHVAVTLGKGVQIYVDGKLQGEGHVKIPCLTDNLEFLEGFSGQISEIRIFNRILNSDDVKLLTEVPPAARSLPDHRPGTL